MAASLKETWTATFPGVPVPKLEELSADQLCNLSVFFIELAEHDHSVYQTPIETGFYGFFFARPQWEDAELNVFALSVRFDASELTPEEYSQKAGLSQEINNVPRCCYCDKWIIEKSCPKLPDDSYSHILCLPGFEPFGQTVDEAVLTR